MKKNDKELISNMEVLVDQLEQEWSRSKEGKCRLEISQSTFRKFGSELRDMVETIHQMTGSKESELSFKESMELTKQAYVLIRLGRKLSNGAKEYADQNDFSVILDKEEYKMFIECNPEYRGQR